MNQRNRLIIVLACVFLFLIITPVIIFYSLGYRFDFETKKIVATGGIYIKASPLGTDIIINSNTDKKTSIFSTYVFVQNLLPKKHSVLIKKEGYFDYAKTLDVKEKEVTKLERVTLFKKSLVFEPLKDQTQSPFIKTPTLENFTLKNNTLYALNIADPIIKNVVTFKESGNIFYLGLDGFLYSLDQNNKKSEKLTQTALTINKKSTYTLFIFGKTIFIKENNNILWLNDNTKSFDDFASQIQDIKLSPDGKKIAYYTKNKVFIYYINYDNQDSYSHEEKISLNTFSEKMQDLYWVNDDYLILALEKSIIISEIDSRNNLNIITLPLPESVSMPAKILFNQSDKKLYILNGKEILVSEKLIP